MKNAVLTLLACLFMGAAFAQGPDPKAMATRQTEWMKTTLQLTPEQTPKVEALNSKYAEKMAELFANRGDNFREQMQSLNGDKEKELQKILTEAQWKTYEEKKGELRRRPGSNN
ncbi:hypothetical protein [Siphonobacter aquaeclarae]|jgi:hypothetical protein|uniref:LTXXQ motif family protein n=1 Tax=Siphonobacter aquaeclarae TaxID=563176 RepID=A0A1G9MHU0_9BACT|nr:hypothetical protein [Siphonobacter aquaeclarae]MBO9638006.1 hypothetical protein [Siphonobacter aquaeclarae]SDL73828.1 hypothetical protein SAMN04488090_1611 [Siphonobacter aquaeclarae]